MNKYRLEYQNIDTMQIIVKFIEAKNLLEATKLMEIKFEPLKYIPVNSWKV